MVQGALAWVLARHKRKIPFPGFKSVKPVEENARALEIGLLNPAQMCQIDEILEW
jgi:aryl-alcohol dehydrogenase-like predicted oxidoreductase